MVDILLHYLQDLPAELVVVIISSIPVIELRGAIPVAIGIYEMSPFTAYLWAVLGNMLPVFFLVYYLNIFSEFLCKHSLYGRRFIKWLYARTRRKLVDKHQRYGALALVLFVAIPLPMTGAWTASIASVIFGIRSKIAVPYILIGVLCAGVIVTVLTIVSGV